MTDPDIVSKWLDVVRHRPDEVHIKWRDHRTRFSNHRENGLPFPRGCVAAACPHDDGKGFSIKLDALPLGGEIVLREPTDKDRVDE